MKCFVLFTNAIETEGRVDVIWNPIPGFTDEFGKAGIHGLPVFIISAAARFISWIVSYHIHAHAHACTRMHTCTLKAIKVYYSTL